MDSEDEEHSPSEFYYPDETNDENATFKLQASCEILKGQDVFELDNEENKNSQEKIWNLLMPKKQRMQSLKPKVTWIYFNVTWGQLTMQKNKMNSYRQQNSTTFFASFYKCPEKQSTIFKWK